MPGFPWRPSLISLRTFQRDKALRGLAWFELRSYGGRHEDLAEILFAGGWRAGDRLRPRFGITESRRSAPASASTKPVELPAGRSVHKRCSVDCGATHRRCKSRASLRGSLSKHGAFLGCKGFYSIGGLVKIEILRAVYRIIGAPHIGRNRTRIRRSRKCAVCNRGVTGSRFVLAVVRQHVAPAGWSQRCSKTMFSSST